MTFINWGNRVFLEGPREPLPHIRYEAQLKSYYSATDPRAWCDDVEKRRRHILELISRTHGACYLQMVAAGDSDEFMRLKRRIEGLDEIIKAYKQLRLTPEQQKQYDTMVSELEDALKLETDRRKALKDALEKFKIQAVSKHMYMGDSYDSKIDEDKELKVLYKDHTLDHRPVRGRGRTKAAREAAEKDEPGIPGTETYGKGRGKGRDPITSSEIGAGRVRGRGRTKTGTKKAVKDTDLEKKHSGTSDNYNGKLGVGEVRGRGRTKALRKSIDSEGSGRVGLLDEDKDKYKGKGENKDTDKYKDIDKYKDKDKYKGKYKDKDKGKDGDKDKPKEEDKDKDKIEDKDTDKYNNIDKSKDKDKDKGKYNDKDKEKDREQDKHKEEDKDKGKYKDKIKDIGLKDKLQDKYEGNDKDKDKVKDKDRDKSEDKDKDKDKDRGKDADKGRRDKDKDKEEDKDKGNDKDKIKDKGLKEKVKGKDRDKSKDKDEHKDKDKDHGKDTDKHTAQDTNKSSTSEELELKELELFREDQDKDDKEYGLELASSDDIKHHFQFPSTMQRNQRELPFADTSQTPTVEPSIETIPSDLEKAILDEVYKSRNIKSPADKERDKLKDIKDKQATEISETKRLQNEAEKKLNRGDKLKDLKDRSQEIEKKHMQKKAPKKLAGEPDTLKDTKDKSITTKVLKKDQKAAKDVPNKLEKTLDKLNGAKDEPKTAEKDLSKKVPDKLKDTKGIPVTENFEKDALEGTSKKLDKSSDKVTKGTTTTEIEKQLLPLKAKSPASTKSKHDAETSKPTKSKQPDDKDEVKPSKPKEKPEITEDDIDTKSDKDKKKVAVIKDMSKDVGKIPKPSEKGTPEKGDESDDFFKQSESKKQPLNELSESTKDTGKTISTDKDKMSDHIAKPQEGLVPGKSDIKTDEKVPYKSLSLAHEQSFKEVPKLLEEVSDKSKHKLKLPFIKEKEKWIRFSDSTDTKKSKIPTPRKKESSADLENEVLVMDPESSLTTSEDKSKLKVLKEETPFEISRVDLKDKGTSKIKEASSFRIIAEESKDKDEEKIPYEESRKDFKEKVPSKMKEVTSFKRILGESKDPISIEEKTSVEESQKDFPSKMKEVTSFRKIPSMNKEPLEEKAPVKGSQKDLKDKTPSKLKDVASFRKIPIESKKSVTTPKKLSLESDSGGSVAKPIKEKKSILKMTKEEKTTQNAFPPKTPRHSKSLDISDTLKTDSETSKSKQFAKSFKQSITEHPSSDARMTIKEKIKDLEDEESFEEMSKHPSEVSATADKRAMKEVASKDISIGVTIVSAEEIKPPEKKRLKMWEVRETALKEIPRLLEKKVPGEHKSKHPQESLLMPIRETPMEMTFLGGELQSVVPVTEKQEDWKVDSRKPSEQLQNIIEPSKSVSSEKVNVSKSSVADEESILTKEKPSKANTISETFKYDEKKFTESVSEEILPEKSSKEMKEVKTASSIEKPKSKILKSKISEPTKVVSKKLSPPELKPKSLSSLKVEKISSNTLPRRERASETKIVKPKIPNAFKVDKKEPKKSPTKEAFSDISVDELREIDLEKSVSKAIGVEVPKPKPKSLSSLKVDSAALKKIPSKGKHIESNVISDAKPKSLSSLKVESEGFKKVPSKDKLPRTKVPEKPSKRSSKGSLDSTGSVLRLPKRKSMERGEQTPTEKHSPPSSVKDTPKKAVVDTSKIREKSKLSPKTIKEGFHFKKIAQKIKEDVKNKLKKAKVQLNEKGVVETPELVTRNEWSADLEGLIVEALIGRQKRPETIREEPSSEEQIPMKSDKTDKPVGLKPRKREDHENANAQIPLEQKELAKDNEKIKTKPPIKIKSKSLGEIDRLSEFSVKERKEKVPPKKLAYEEIGKVITDQSTKEDKPVEITSPTTMQKQFKTDQKPQDIDKEISKSVVAEPTILEDQPLIYDSAVPLKEEQEKPLYKERETEAIPAKLIPDSDLFSKPDLDSKTPSDTIVAKNLPKPTEPIEMTHIKENQELPEFIESAASFPDMAVKIPLKEKQDKGASKESLEKQMPEKFTVISDILDKKRYLDSKSKILERPPKVAESAIKMHQKETLGEEALTTDSGDKISVGSDKFDEKPHLDIKSKTDESTVKIPLKEKPGKDALEESYQIHFPDKRRLDSEISEKKAYLASEPKIIEEQVIDSKILPTEKKVKEPAKKRPAMLDSDIFEKKPYLDSKPRIQEEEVIDSKIVPKEKKVKEPLKKTSEMLDKQMPKSEVISRKEQITKDAPVKDKEDKKMPLNNFYSNIVSPKKEDDKQKNKELLLKSEANIPKYKKSDVLVERTKEVDSVMPLEQKTKHLKEKPIKLKESITIKEGDSEKEVKEESPIISESYIPKKVNKQDLEIQTEKAPKRKSKTSKEKNQIEKRDSADQTEKIPRKRSIKSDGEVQTISSSVVSKDAVEKELVEIKIPEELQPEKDSLGDIRTDKDEDHLEDIDTKDLAIRDIPEEPSVESDMPQNIITDMLSKVISSAIALDDLEIQSKLEHDSKSLISELTEDQAQKESLGDFPTEPLVGSETSETIIAGKLESEVPSAILLDDIERADELEYEGLISDFTPDVKNIELEKDVRRLMAEILLSFEKDEYEPPKIDTKDKIYIPPVIYKQQPTKAEEKGVVDKKILDSNKDDSDLHQIYGKGKYSSSSAQLLQLLSKVTSDEKPEEKQSGELLENTDVEQQTAADDEVVLDKVNEDKDKLKRIAKRVKKEVSGKVKDIQDKIRKARHKKMLLDENQDLELQDSDLDSDKSQEEIATSKSDLIPEKTKDVSDEKSDFGNKLGKLIKESVTSLATLKEDEGKLSEILENVKEKVDIILRDKEGYNDIAKVAQKIKEEVKDTVKDIKLKLTDSGMIDTPEILTRKEWSSELEALLKEALFDHQLQYKISLEPLPEIGSWKYKSEDTQSEEEEHKSIAGLRKAEESNVNDTQEGSLDELLIPLDFKESQLLPIESLDLIEKGYQRIPEVTDTEKNQTKLSGKDRLNHLAKAVKKDATDKVKDIKEKLRKKPRNQGSLEDIIEIRSDVEDIVEEPEKVDTITEEISFKLPEYFDRDSLKHKLEDLLEEKKKLTDEEMLPEKDSKTSDLQIISSPILSQEGYSKDILKILDAEKPGELTMETVVSPKEKPIMKKQESEVQTDRPVKKRHRTSKEKIPVEKRDSMDQTDKVKKKRSITTDGEAQTTSVEEIVDQKVEEEVEQKISDKALDRTDNEGSLIKDSSDLMTNPSNTDKTESETSEQKRAIRSLISKVLFKSDTEDNIFKTPREDETESSTIEEMNDMSKYGKIKDDALVTPSEEFPKVKPKPSKHASYYHIIKNALNKKPGEEFTPEERKELRRALKKYIVIKILREPYFDFEYKKPKRKRTNKSAVEESTTADETTMDDKLEISFEDKLENNLEDKREEQVEDKPEDVLEEGIEYTDNKINDDYYLE